MISVGTKITNGSSFEDQSYEAPDHVWQQVIAFSQIPKPTLGTDATAVHFCESDDDAGTKHPFGTRLEGTTWYQHGLWPSQYWRLWSDAIIHKIHLRVLRHIRDEVEAR